MGSSREAVANLATALGSQTFVVGEPKGLLQRADPVGEVVAWLDDHPEAGEPPVSVRLPAQALFEGLGHFQGLLGRKVVFHAEVAPSGDFSSISALRQCGFVFLQSFGPEDAQDTALAAFVTSERLEQPVIHFYAQVERSAPTKWSQELLGAALATGAAPEEKAVEPLGAVENALEAIGGNYEKYEYRGPSNAKKALLIFGNVSESLAEAADLLEYGLLTARVYSPLDPDALLNTLPPQVKDIVVLEQIAAPSPGLMLPLTQDIFGASRETLSRFENIGSFRLGILDEPQKALESLNFDSPFDLPPLVGSPLKAAQIHLEEEAIVTQSRKQEQAYTQVLHQLFPWLRILNEDVPEYGFGRYLEFDRRQAELLREAPDLVKKGEPHSNLISEWVTSSGKAGGELNKKLNDAGLSQYVNHENWIVGSDAWAYDLGNSGAHHVLTSGKNVKMLVIDSSPESEIRSTRQRKKDIGLYALGFTEPVYVASVAIYSSYTQVLQALLEAQAFDGPAIVLAYLPRGSDALDSLKETKRAVETGYWPLYRYRPTNDEFILDSYTIRKNLEMYLERRNKLSLLASQKPRVARDLELDENRTNVKSQLQKAKSAYAQLLEGLSGPPVLVLFASDGGQAENVARRLARRAKQRGLKSTVCAFDDIEEVEALTNEQHVIFVTSTAGQGEFPQNGRALWDQLKNATDLDLSSVKVGVFGMGDSQYWPRKQDKHYYNKPSNDLSAKLKLLGAEELVPLGQGDDQGADGWATGYNEWEPKVWEALGVANVAVADEPPPKTNEDIKLASNYLRGTIAEGLQDESTGAVSADDQQLTKFHGIYMQDDRDVRDVRKAEGLEPAYIFMARLRLPGSVASPRQWLKVDELSSTRGNETFKISTRGTFQLHGIIKENLKPAIRGLNSELLDTVAACGDNIRGVVTSSSTHNAAVHRQIFNTAKSLSDNLIWRSTSYYEIWLEGDDATDPADNGQFKAWESQNTAYQKKDRTLVGQSTIEDKEPLYGPTYLPRKFKINISVPPYNDADVYGHDIGFIAIVNEKNEVEGYNALVGGGMGTTHNNRKTYPRVGSLMGFVPVSKAVDFAEKVMMIHRDFGDRKNRKHARLKYVVDDLTVDGFKAKLQEYLGYELEPAREHVPFKTNVDPYGWIRDEEGNNHFTCFIENGRVEDTPELQQRTGLREIAQYFEKNKFGEFRLTANQHVILSNIPDSFKPQVSELMSKYQLDNLAFSGLRLASASCVAFPTCGLAMAESERYLPELITKLESALEEYGLRHDSIVMRMGGCPNGCSRGWLGEVALIGKAYGAYNLMLGGGHVGQRLNKLYRSSLKEDEILKTLKPMFKQWALERTDGEPFGDFVIRKGIISATINGTDWWDNVEPGVE